jgi:hypothetical protein
MDKDITDEKQMLLDSLPFENDAAFAWGARINERARQHADCPPLTELLELRWNTVAPERIAKLEEHFAVCANCRSWHERLTASWSQETARQEHARLFRSSATATPPAPTPMVPEREAAAGAETPGAGGEERLAALARSLSRHTRFLTRVTRGNKREAVQSLREYFPTFLAAVGLNADLAADFERFLLQHADEIKAPAFLPPLWLERFAAGVLQFAGLPYEPTAEEWEETMNRYFVERLLATGLSPAESEEQQRFRALARERGVRTREGLQTLVDEGNFSQGLGGTYPVALARRVSEERSRLYKFLCGRVL